MKPLLLALALLPLALCAQTPTEQSTTTTSNIALFRARLPGGTYQVAVRAIVAVSSHEYLVDGAVRVSEVNIDTTGSMLVRFYFLEPTTPVAPLGLGQATAEKAQDLLKQAAEKSGQDVWKKVVKNYPTTTHARTVEYRLVEKADLNKIYDAAEEAFRLQKPKSVTVGEK